ncbi:SGNH/GDSL hydrolase family protein [Microlunatus soli]|uniref:GDSL-like Lipase/Acylhydrolase family protein n=1 Tax=Microlunatus soli TaxID=630515 RepID=A0A1H1PUL4_9ACTN|nr:SGNH/GDSL hydrolase family protein [Microlunatus soli]SDS14773.1 GDSL-like Lipase/Acylhydrolase family protein [Microlunatus soli]
MTHLTLRRILLTTAAATLVGLTAISPARAAATGYVALGDSYSAGVGTHDKADDCYRSPSGYPALLAGGYGLSLNYQACNGADTADVVADQLAALSADTGAVSLTVGGNDVGFADVLTECAQPGWLSDCAGAIADGRTILTEQLPGRYDSLLGSIADRAPHATVAVAGYPRIFNGEDCNAATFFSPEEESDLNAAVDEMDALISGKAGANGFDYVDPRSAFDGHAVCDDQEWVNGLSEPIEESYHPNRDGNVGYAELVGPVLTGRPFPTAVRPEADRLPQLSDSQRLHQQADIVLSFDLDSAANLERADRHGIDPDRIRRLATMLRSSDSDTIAAALDELQRLDRRAS